MGGFPSGQRGQTVNLLHIASVVRIHHHPLPTGIKINIAGWSSLEARRAHNPEVIGSNPIPATQRHAQLAQLVEQRTENPRVSGSIPELGIFFLDLMQCFGHCFFLLLNGGIIIIVIKTIAK